MTYHLPSHVGPEDDSHIYRALDEINEWKDLSPITHLHDLVILSIDFSTTDLIDLGDEEIEKAFEHARAAPYPSSPDWVKTNVANNNHLSMPIYTSD